MDPDLDEIELDFFINAMRRHGYDLGQYARASLKRRVRGLVAQHGFEHIGALASRVLRDAAFLPRVVEGLSVPVSEMFRDPYVFAALRTLVFPTLASYPHINIWQAGCAHGEEMYSLAILLEEAGLYDRCQIYATDFSDAALARAREGIFTTREARTASLRYLQAGGSRTLADYYHARYDLVKLDDRLRRNVIFANHNLATDSVFCEAHLVLCRNVLIYFNNALQDHVLSLFSDSLVRGGYLCLGTKENLSLAPAARHFIDVDRNARIFRSTRTG